MMKKIALYLMMLLSSLGYVYAGPPSFTTDTSTYVYDIGYEDLKAVPGNDMVFMYSLENSDGPPDDDTLVLKFNIPSTLAFKLDSFTFVDGEIVGSLGYDPMYDGDPTGTSDLSCCTTEISYSDDGGSTFTYTPQNVIQNDFGEWYDPTVNAVKIVPSGTMADGSGSPVGFRVYFLARIL